PWQMLAGGLSRATPSLVDAAGFIGKIRFPRETLVLSGLAQAAFDFLLSLPVLAGLLWYYGQPPQWTAAAAVLLVFLQLVLMSGLGYMLALLHAAVRDVGNAMPLVLVVWMFLTPVVYPAPEEVAGAEQSLPASETRAAGQSGAAGVKKLTDRRAALADDAARPQERGQAAPGAVGRAQWVLSVVNPMYPLVVGYRDLMLRGTLTMPGRLAWSAAVCIGVGLFGWRLFYLAGPKIAERV
ncbi:MAG: ABC transporter permease, partial [Pirellulales bacterium]